MVRASTFSSPQGEAHAPLGAIHAHEARRDGGFGAREATIPHVRLLTWCTRAASVWHEAVVACGGKRSSRPGIGGDFGILRVLAVFASLRVSRP